MPIYEFKCLKHGVIEKVIIGSIKGLPRCPKCDKIMEAVEFSVPAKRNPEHGIQ